MQENASLKERDQRERAAQEHGSNKPGPPIDEAVITVRDELSVDGVLMLF